MRHVLFVTLAVGIGALVSTHAQARPIAPQKFCEHYASSPWCQGQAVQCDFCHISTGPPEWNTYGESIRAQLGVDLSDQEFLDALPGALDAVGAEDPDGDGFENVDEIHGGSLPYDAASTPGDLSCPDDTSELDYPICEFSRRHVFRKVHLDFCGCSPSWEEMQDFLQLTDEQQDTALSAALNTCLDSEFWIGKNGVVWKMAHDKVRPVGSLKAGEDEDPNPQIPKLADYYNDYNLFVWSHIDGNDVRSVLTADFYVLRDTDPTTYSVVGDLPDDPNCPGCEEHMLKDRRNGMMTTRWYMGYFIMFTALPRAAAAQAYRSYLGYDIAKSQGLDHPIDGEPLDHDNKGVDDAVCAVCHSTLDPLMYAFRNYNGISAPVRYQYVPNRLEIVWPNDTALHATPENGFILGQAYNDLNDWADIAADSDDFVIAVTRDYWRMLIGREPLPNEAEEFASLWDGLKNNHDYSVEKMLHDLIMTEAYGAP